ncbi:MAG: class II fumarate hydratase [Candidatus Dadabacteria bacterium]|nr:MAG: class II fumarate hydratase [Candidatus Dadabacteria bacterium]
MRKEKDSMGEMEVPDSALWGASTQRAVLNFPISKMRLQRPFIKALGAIKWSAARANKRLGLLEAEKADAIEQAAKEVIDGMLDEHFVVDVFQTGSGTSTNMNANEVIANRALQLLGKEIGDRETIHPNDNVNLCQSSNDVIPTALHISLLSEIKERLLPVLELAYTTLRKKSEEFKDVVKSGRTHLQDATPVTLGQEFSGWAEQVKQAKDWLSYASSALANLTIGGTAVGTGINCHPQFSTYVCEELSALYKINFSPAKNHFALQGSQDPAVFTSAALRNTAVAFFKIANDIRWLSSGPRCGLAEISLPEVQPGSSIMPGKVNPVICESLLMVCMKVIGNDASTAFAGTQGNFELNVTLPLIAYQLLESVEILTNGIKNFIEKCVVGIKANTERCKYYAEMSPALCTALAVEIGYDKAAQLAKKALKENLSIKEIAVKEGILTKEKAEEILNPLPLTKGGLVKK